MACLDQLADNYAEEKEELTKLQNQVIELRSAKIELLEKLQASSSLEKPYEQVEGRFP